MSVVYNQGTNYTLYYNALDYFKTIMTNHPSIAKVTTGDMMEVDTKEFPMYPIGNINIFNTNISDSTTKFEIQLVVADKIKNKNNESNPTNNEQTIPFYGTDDTIDILANTLAIINDLTSYTEYAVAAFDIDSDILCEPFVDRFNNGLAGHVATFTLTTHNDRNRCLFFLINPSGSGYQIRNCSTSETYYAVLASQVQTGSVFSTRYPSNGTCYEVLQEVDEYDSWNLVNLPVNNVYGNCVACANAQTTTTTTSTTTTLAPTTTTTVAPTTTTTLAPTTTTTTLEPTTTTTSTTSTTTTTLAPTTTTTAAPTTTTTTLAGICYNNTTVFFESVDDINFYFGYTRCDGSQGAITGGTATTGSFTFSPTGSYCLRSGGVVAIYEETRQTVITSISQSNQCGSYTPTTTSTTTTTTSTTTSTTTAAPVSDIVRDGLLFAFDTYDYVSGSNVLVDKSGNGYDAVIKGSGSLEIIEGVGMQFTGVSGSAYLQFTSQSIYPAWQYTTQTHLSVPDNLPNNTFMNICSAGGGSGAWHWTIDPSGSTTLPNNLVWQNALVNTTYDFISSSYTNATLTSTGTETYNGAYTTGTGSLCEQYFNTSKLPSSGINYIPFRSFNWASNDMVFGRYNSVSFGSITIEWAALTGSVQYIAYYDRPLTSAEVQQNNLFYLSGNPIP